MGVGILDDQKLPGAIVLYGGPDDRLVSSEENTVFVFSLQIAPVVKVVAALLPVVVIQRVGGQIFFHKTLNCVGNHIHSHFRLNGSFEIRGQSFHGIVT